MATKVNASEDRRVCTRCGVPKDRNFTNFYPVTVKHDGMSRVCRDCKNELIRIKRAKAPNSRVAQRAKIAQRKVEKARLKELRAAERLADADARKARKALYVAGWHGRNRLRVEEIKRDWYLKNKGNRLSPSQRDKMNARRRERAAQIPAIRINASMSHRIRDGIVERKEGRSWTTFVPYSLEQLMAHLERQFKKGMTWENYGPRWHIDHILPLSRFDIQSFDSDEFRAAWALTNLQPLWAKENKTKNDKRIYLL